MKISGKVSLLIALMLAMGVVSPAIAAGPPNPYVGAWVNTDIYDGSTQNMFVGGPSSRVNIRYVDYGGSVCGEVDEFGDPTVSAFFSGVGEVNEDGVLIVENVPLYCQYPDSRGKTFMFNFSGSWELQPDGTILMSDGNVFSRR